MPAAESFQQLAWRFTDPVQRDYAAIRAIMLADETVAERSRVTGLSRDTISTKARRFLEDGMLGLVDRRTMINQGRHQYPDVVASYILSLKQRYPAIHYRELGRIIARKDGYQSHHRTIKHFLERHALPVQLPLPRPSFHQFADAYQARWTVVRRYYEGWQQQRSASCLGRSRKHV